MSSTSDDGPGANSRTTRCPSVNLRVDAVGHLDGQCRDLGMHTGGVREVSGQCSASALLRRQARQRQFDLGEPAICGSYCSIAASEFEGQRLDRPEPAARSSMRGTTIADPSSCDSAGVNLLAGNGEVSRP
jgi:hypothetical protein